MIVQFLRTTLTRFNKLSDEPSKYEIWPSVLPSLDSQQLITIEVPNDNELLFPL
jgi:hypothetical protein